MITEEQSQEIKEHIGANYATKIAEYLHKKAVRNKNGLPYTTRHIINVVNGMQSEQLEIYIFDAVKFYKRKNLREAKRREKLLKSA